MTLEQGNAVRRVLRCSHVEGREDPSPAAEGQCAGVSHGQERGQVWRVAFAHATSYVCVCVQVDVCVRKLSALLNAAPLKPKPTVAVPPLLFLH